MIKTFMIFSLLMSGVGIPSTTGLRSPPLPSSRAKTRDLQCPRTTLILLSFLLDQKGPKSQGQNHRPTRSSLNA